MRFIAIVLASLCGLLALRGGAEAGVAIAVDLASQTMHVSSASGDYDWPISSARAGFRTPRGSYGVQRMEAMHRSRKYHNAPMPHSLFFSGGYAIHGTDAVGALGRPASHGCIRIAPGNAAALFQMVRAEGARISITGRAPIDVIRTARRDTQRAYARAVARQRGVERALALRGYIDPSLPLGYAPLVDPSVYRWIADPTGY